MEWFFFVQNQMSTPRRRWMKLQIIHSMKYNLVTQPGSDLRSLPLDNLSRLVCTLYELQSFASSNYERPFRCKIKQYKLIINTTAL